MRRLIAAEILSLPATSFCARSNEGLCAWQTGPQWTVGGRDGWTPARQQSHQGCATLYVSQLSIDPDFSPVMNQRMRCCEEPWVKASGTT
jgi:hypothetical protein